MVLGAYLSKNKRLSGRVAGARLKLFRDHLKFKPRNISYTFHYKSLSGFGLERPVSTRNLRGDYIHRPEENHIRRATPLASSGGALLGNESTSKSDNQQMALIHHQLVMLR